MELYTETHDCKFPFCSQCVISSCSESGTNTLCGNSEMKRSLNASYSTDSLYFNNFITEQNRTEHKFISTLSIHSSWLSCTQGLSSMSKKACSGVQYLGSIPYKANHFKQRMNDLTISEYYSASNALMCNKPFQTFDICIYCFLCLN